MKRNLLLMVWVGMISHALTQPTLNANSLVQLGESVEVQFVNEPFAPGAAGANVSWDFSTYLNNDFSFIWAFAMPDTTPFVDSFPSANLAVQTLFESDSVDNWLYYHLDDNAGSLERLGAAGALFDQNLMSMDTFFQVLEDDPALEFKHPISFGDNFTDQLAGQNHVAIGGMVFQLDRSGSRQFSADAWGTLTTPAGSFQNVLRVRVEENINDALLGFPSTNQKNVRYYWYSPDERYVLMQMDSLAVIPVQGPSSVSFSIFYRKSDVIASVEKKLATRLAMQAFPNPASGQCTLSFSLDQPQTLQFSLRNLIGQQLLKYPAQSFPAGEHTQSLALSGISPGLYFLTLESEEGTASLQIMLQ